MTVTSIDKDHEALTLTVHASFTAPVERVWQIWADPRLLERWWGPPTYPATFVDHDLRPGGRCSYFMTSPEGEKYHGWWEIIAVAEPQSLELRDGFADDSGTPTPDMPTSVMHMTLEADGEGTRMVLQTTFPSPEAMAQLEAMGMDEGLGVALGQIDALL